MRKDCATTISQMTDRKRVASPKRGALSPSRPADFATRTGKDGVPGASHSTVGSRPVRLPHSRESSSPAPNVASQAPKLVVMLAHTHIPVRPSREPVHPGFRTGNKACVARVTART
jgi:hypothetical protein